MPGVGLFLLRIGVGFVAIVHGLTKLFPLTAGGPAAAADVLASAGITPAYPVAVATGLVELLTGALLLLGAYTIWTCAVLIATSVVVAWPVHVPQGLLLNWSMAPEAGYGYEYTLVLISALSCLLLSGPGMLSIDRRRARIAETLRLSRARLRAGGR